MQQPQHYITKNKQLVSYMLYLSAIKESVTFKRTDKFVGIKQTGAFTLAIFVVGRVANKIAVAQ